MADLALVFGWTPEAMDRMPLADLMDWRERARRRYAPDKSDA
ncbi:GpE family phage tail protein [uncultured Pseudacidovorax sp.]|nr:GpE family phage tail protein [uncultured Pseudacidovorax sp.]